MARVRIFEKPLITEPVSCPYPWDVERDAGYACSKEECIARWDKPHLRPCGRLHGVVDKRNCIYTCGKGKKIEASGENR